MMTIAVKYYIKLGKATGARRTCIQYVKWNKLCVFILAEIHLSINQRILWPPFTQKDKNNWSLKYVKRHLRNF